MGPRIAIIGGGIGGLTAAVALARQGLGAEVYEQAPVLEEVGAGVGLWPNAMAALQPIGLSAKVARLAVEIARHGVRQSDGTWLMYFPAELMVQRWGAGLALVHRAELLQLLAAELDPSAIHLGARCTGVEDGNRAVTALFADGRDVQADVVVGADGVHSAVRAALFGPARLRYRGYITVRGITTAGSVPLPADGAETWGRGARFGLGPIGGDRIIWWATWNAVAGGKDDGGTAARLRELFGAWHDPIPAVIDATPQTAVIRKDISDRRPTRTWSRGRVALLGDAIHPMTPNLGQGACQAILDATTLATCLAASGDSRAALRDYQQRRWRNAAFNTLMARTVGGMGQWDGRIACTARNSLTQAMPLSLQLRQFDLLLGATRQAHSQRKASRLSTSQLASRWTAGLPCRAPPSDIVPASFGPIRLINVVSIGTPETPMSDNSAHSAGSYASGVRALVVASHPGPILVITAMVTALTAYAAPRGPGPVLAAPAILAGQLSVGWSNDACDAARDSAAGRTDKPVARGDISVRTAWIAAFSALAVAAILSAQIGPRWLLINAVMVGAAWAYNLGLKATWASGLMYFLGFAPLPAFATSTLPAQPWPTWQVTAAAGCVGLGAHFANVLPDLAADRLTGVKGLPQIVAARWGERAARTAAIMLLLAASVLLLLAAIPSRRWVSVTSLAVAAILALVGFRSSGKTPFHCALGIAAVDVVLFLTGSEALT